MFRRLANLIRGFFGLFISGLEKQNPQAVLENEKERLRAQIAKYNQGLAAHAGLLEQLMGRIRSLEAEEQDLKAKTTANLRAGNRERAAEYALKLGKVSADLEEFRKQLEQGETTYQDLVQSRDAAVRAAQEKLEQLKRSIDEMRVQQAQAELNEMATGMITSIGGAGDTLDRVQQMVEEERARAAGRARVARDSLPADDLRMEQAERQALAEQALADFAAREGIPLEPTTTEAPAESGEPPKTMGPATESEEQS